MRTNIFIILFFYFSIVLGQTVPYPNSITGGSNGGIVGKLESDFTVTPLGQASYDMPIVIPQGTGGMAPILSVVYNSATKEGLLGSGFDLSGLSMINRTPSNLHVDGKAGYVNFTSSDQFMLDGQRLIHVRVINSTTNEYRTENNSFSKIIATGERINPTSFTVYTKSGLIYEYGSNTGQLKSTSSNSVLFWLLRKVSDTKNNYYTISYERDDANGEYWPVRMDYTGNTDTKLSPYNSVRFEYESNYYPKDSYIYGMKVRKSKNLTKINIYSGEKKISYYSFTYQTNYNRRQLIEVNRFAADGTKINPTKFTWHNSNDFKNYEAYSYTGFVGNNTNIHVADFDGDGKADFLVAPNGENKITGYWYLVLSKGDDWWVHNSSHFSQGGITLEVTVGDFNGDGLVDLIRKREHDGGYGVYYNADYYEAEWEETSYGSKKLKFVYKKTILSDKRNYSIRAVEVNGDGAADLFAWYHNSKECKIIYSQFNNNELYPLNYTATRNCSINWERVEYVDFNGDGLTDIMNLHENGYYLLESDGYGTMSQTKSSNYPKKKHHIHFGDYNGDGKTDMLLTGYDDDKNAGGWSNWFTYFSTGNGFENVQFTRKYNTHDKSVFVADINGDGKDDLYVVDKKKGDTPTPIYNLINNGNGTDFIESGGTITNGTDRWKYYIGDFNGDGKTDFVCTSDSKKTTWNGYKIYLVPKKLDNLLANIKDGLGAEIDINYSTMSDPKVYWQNNLERRYPLTSYSSNSTLVYKISFSNGLGGKNNTIYKYGTAMMHRRGRGVLGFTTVSKWDENSKSEIENTYEVDPTQYIMALQKTYTSYYYSTNGNRTIYTNKLKYYDNNKIFTYGEVESVTQVLENDRPISTLNSLTEYDSYGNATKITTKLTDPSGRASLETTTTVNKYNNDETKWHLGRLIQTTVTKNKGTESITRKSEFEYNPTSGLLVKEVLEPNETKGYTKTYEHDSYGNIVKSVVTPHDKNYSARTKTSIYDPTYGRFETESKNSLNFSTKNEIDYEKGVVNSITDENNIKTEYTYNGFGDILTTKTPLGYIQQVLRWSNGHPDAPTNAKYFVCSESTGKPQELEFFDILGRSLRIVTIGYNNEKIYQDKVYNNKGQIIKSSEPYFAGQTIYWNEYEYDSRSRVIKEIYPDKSNHTFEYEGLVVTTIDQLGQYIQKTYDCNNNLLKSVDNAAIVDYKYDALGNCVQIIGPRTTIKIEYDKYGNKKKLIDPDLGTIEYDYNCFGELVLQKDIKGSTTFAYDNLGRIKKEVSPEGTRENFYDVDYKNTLYKSTFNTHTKTYSYDTNIRPIKTTEVIDGKIFITETSYNANNQIDIITYPSNLKVQNEYNSNGYLTKVKNVSTSKYYWQAGTMNARKQLEKFTLGNNLTTTINHNAAKGYISNIVTPNIQNWTYSYNLVGNLTERKDNLKNLTEHFDYDVMNRIWKVSKNGSLQQEILYDEAGNITSKTGVGTYFDYYDGTNRLKSVSGGNYSPPHWDEIRYNSQQKIIYVKQGTSSLSIFYGMDGNRIKSTTTRNGISEIKYYAGTLYEEVRSGTEVRQLNYIFADGVAVAIYEKSNNNGEKTRYLHKDHLGSIQAYSDENGKLIQELSYDAWGRRRNPVTWQYYTKITDAKAWHTRGFTGHEHLDDFEMINMNGRMYDPVIGRFLSPDPFIQAPDFSQGLNRYSYCMNNPLSLFDPSGYSWFSKNWKSLVTAVVGVVVSVASAGIGSGLGGAMIAGALGGAAAGLTGALLNGSNIGQVIKSTFTGGFWGAAGGFLANAAGGGNFLERLFKHTFSQGWLEGIRGGNIKHGMIAGATSVIGGAAISKYGSNMGKVGKVTSNAVLSGTVTELGGGKFANGAITGTFTMLFNDMMHVLVDRLTKAELQIIYEAYPKGNVLKRDALYEEIGGDVLDVYNEYKDDPVYADNMKNTCAVRLSRALNYGGWKIPEGTKNTFTGADGNGYFLNAKYMYEYLKKSDVFGPSTVLKTGTKLTDGIYFQTGNFTNASGHVDVILNGTAGSKYYNTRTTYYWVVDP